MAKPKILIFAGSTRTDSYNKKLVRLAMEATKKAGAEATYLDGSLKDSKQQTAVEKIAYEVTRIISKLN